MMVMPVVAPGKVVHNYDGLHDRGRRKERSDD
jgi:hypothetical protein